MGGYIYVESNEREIKIDGVNIRTNKIQIFPLVFDVDCPVGGAKKEFIINQS